MFSDPLNITTPWNGEVRSFARTDAGNKSGEFSHKTATESDSFAIRNTEYNSKALKRKVKRHNIEFTRMMPVAATTTSPATTRYVKAYMVIEHDEFIDIEQIKGAAGVAAAFVMDSLNSGYVAKLVNEEA